jgi:hypothetical protein
MNTVSRLVSVSSKFAFAAVVAASLVACGGSSDPVVFKAASNVTVAANPTNAAATTAVLTAGQTYSFTDLSGLGVSGPATMTFSSTTDPTAVPFTLKAGTTTVTGVMSYGSCIFTLTNPSAPPTGIAGLDAKLTKGTNGKYSYEVAACGVTLGTQGQSTGSSPTVVTTFTVGGSAATGSTPVTVVIANDGSVTANGVKVGTVSITTGVSGS